MFGEVAKRVRVEIEVSFADDEIRRLQVAEFAQFGIGEGGLPRPAPPQQIDAADVARAEGLQRVIGNVCLFQLLRRPAQNPSNIDCDVADSDNHDFLFGEVECTIAKVGMTIVDRKSTRLNSSHVAISYAVFCLKKK